MGAEIIVAGTGFETESERVTSELLRQLPSSWLVIANKFLVMDHGKSFEIDFIVVGDHRIIVLDDKFWRGPITGSTEFWTVQSWGASRKSPLNQAERTAIRVMGFLSNRGVNIPYSGKQPIIGAVILTHPESGATINDPRAKHCLMTRANAIEKLRWLDQEGQKAGLDLGPHRAAIKKALYDQDDIHRPKTPKKINFFRVEEKLDERAHCRVYSAVHEDDESRRTLYVYQQLDAATDKQLDRELSALKKLQSTGIVPTIESSFPWGEDGAKVVPVRPPDGTAWGALPAPDGEEAARWRLATVATAFDGLARLHAEKVIHRGIDPTNVIVGERPVRADGAPGATTVAFTDFVFARIEGTETIALQLDELGFGDPYASPAITRMESYGFADASSDVYSLALVTLETVMGVEVAAIVAALETTDDLPTGPGLWPFVPDAFVPQLASVYRSALTAGPYKGNTEMPPQEIATALRGIVDQLGADRAKVVAGAAVTGGAVADERYRVQRLLGEGAYARTYLVIDTVTSELVAAKQYTRRDMLENDKGRIVAEYKTLWSNWHPNLPKPVHVDPTHPQFQLVLEYIPGETLGARLPFIANDRDRWADVMRGLLAAVQHLEEHGILHRDVKPDNVMIREDDDHIFLIDHGAATTAGQRASLAGAPGYWPPEWKDGLELPAGSDRYAAAVTLFEALTGESPFRDDTAGFSRELTGTLPASLRPELHAVGTALLQAMAVDPAARPGTTAELRAELEQALNVTDVVVLPPVEPTVQLTDWVTRLRGLFRNSRGGNADNRGLDSAFAKETYVETALDTRLWPAIQQHRPAVVFLSGNPGDGKTAFLEHVREELIKRGAPDDGERDPSGWELTLSGHVYRACFDASEAVDNRTATQQLAHRMRGLEGTTPVSGITVLVAINDGRLREVSEELEESHPWLIDTLREARGLTDAEEVMASGVWVIDLKRRAYVSLEPAAGEPSVMRQMLATMVDAGHWTGDAALAPHFPPAANAIALRSDGQDGPADRLEYLLALAHLRGDRHTTVRDLRSALALLITSDLDYAVHREAGVASGEYPWTHRYWNVAFTTDASRDLVLGELRWLDPARFAHPVLERFLYFHHRPEDAPARARLFAIGVDEAPPAGDDPDRLKDWIGAVKRRLFFEGATRATADPIPLDPLGLVPYSAAGEMIAVLAGRSEGEALKATILRGIGRSDDIAAANDGTDLVLRVKKSEEHRIEIVKTFPAGEFALEVDRRSDAGLIEVTPRTITLRHAPSKAHVRLNLDVIEVLTRLADGLTPRSQELQPLIEELAPFKSRLQRSVSHRLLVIEGGRRHLILKEGDQLIRRDA